MKLLILIEFILLYVGSVSLINYLTVRLFNKSITDVNEWLGFALVFIWMVVILKLMHSLNPYLKLLI